MGTRANDDPVRQRLETLRREEERYRAIAEQTTEGIWRFDLTEPVPINLPLDRQIDLFYERGYMGECNRQMAAMYGFDSPDQLIGIRLGDLVTRQDPANEEYLRSFVRSGYKLRDARSHEVDRDGRPKYFLNNLTGYITDGQLTHVWGTQRDVTTIKLAEDALLHTEKLASAGRLAAAVAHEINNPLAAVTNLLYLLEQSKALDEQARHFLQMAQTEMKRLSEISKRTLSFYRDSSAPAPVELGVLLDDIAELYVARLRKKNLRIEKWFSAVPTVSGYEGELRQVFSNLLLNAIEASEPGSVVELSLQNAAGRAQVEVKDHGRGIPAPELPHIFEPFFTTKREGGSGLGLWVARQVVEKHGGNISVSSPLPGETGGASFIVVL